MITKKYNTEIYLIFSFAIILLSNNFFSFEETLKFGGSDGNYYMMISKFAPNFGENIEYIKGERFFFPFILGIFSNFTGLDDFYTYQIFSIFLCMIFIYLLNLILNFLNISKNIKFISFCLVIFNPYLLRYFIAIPTLLIDLVFLISIELVIISFLNKKKFFLILGFSIAMLSRQNGLFILLSLFVSKFFFKENSFFSFKDLIVYTFIFFLIYMINTFYAEKSQGNTDSFENLYHSTLFGIFYFDYTLKKFLEYLFFPALSFGPIILFFVLSLFYLKIDNLNNELLIYLLILAVLIIGIAFVGGPNTTGKNLIRLSNFAYINLLISINIVYFKNKFNNFKVNNFIKALILFTSLLWSFHPTFSKIKIFSFIQNLIIFS